jgi:hypothetical protein
LVNVYTHRDVVLCKACPTKGRKMLQVLKGHEVMSRTERSGEEVRKKRQAEGER